MTDSRIPPQRPTEAAQERCAGCTHRRSNHNIGMRSGELGYVDCSVCTGCTGFAEQTVAEPRPTPRPVSATADLPRPRAADAVTAASSPGDADPADQSAVQDAEWLAHRRSRGFAWPPGLPSATDLVDQIDASIENPIGPAYGSWDAYLCPRCGHRRFETFVCCLGPARPVLVTITFRETP